MLLPKAHQEAHIAGERPAGEGSTWRKIRARPDPPLTLKAALDLFCVGADQLTQARQLVDERDGCGQKCVERVLSHLSRLNRHPLNALAEWREERGEQRLIALVAQSDD